jgi:hypothetical protein
VFGTQDDSRSREAMILREGLVFLKQTNSPVVASTNTMYGMLSIQTPQEFNEKELYGR